MEIANLQMYKVDKVRFHRDRLSQYVMDSELFGSASIDRLGKRKRCRTARLPTRTRRSSPISDKSRWAHLPVRCLPLPFIYYCGCLTPAFLSVRDRTAAVATKRHWSWSSRARRKSPASGPLLGCKSNLHNRLILSEHFRHDQGAEWAPVT